MLHLMNKVIDYENSPVLYDRPFTRREVESGWKVYGGEWTVEDGWLTGKNPENAPGMMIAREDYPGNVLIDFEGRTVLPSTHDIDFMWNGSWDEAAGQRGPAYIAGIQGWWEGKAGFEKSPEYKLGATTPLLDFKPGEIYRIQGGSIDGHCFLFVNGKLVLEMMDPDPIDSMLYTKVGFEAYCSHIQVRNLKILQIKWSPLSLSYPGEF